jgi:peptide chain release factor 2
MTILTLKAQHGSVECEDFLGRLLRMYIKWGERHEKKFKVIASRTGNHLEFAEITLSFEGAYDLLQYEHGTHRLSQISAYDTKRRRHHSHVSCEVLPIKEEWEVDIKQTDIRVDVERRSMVGGQQLNWAMPAGVRIMHSETGIVGFANEEKSQIRNRDQAMIILRSKLYAYQNPELFTTSIRKYILDPFKRVVDDRFGIETNDVDSVFEGNIDLFHIATESRD